MEKQIEQIKGGVCAAKGFKAAGIHCGIRNNTDKKDLALIFSEVPATAAAVYTTNIVKSASILVTKKNIEDGTAQAIICNSGNANTSNGNGLPIAQAMSDLCGEALGISSENIIVASTGVIGVPMSIEPIKEGLPDIVTKLSKDGSKDAAEGIMTTDTIEKEVAVSFVIGDKTCHIGGIAKGSGMIHPNLATMLVFITTDVAINQSLLQQALSKDVEDSFNMVSIDGDTSTNDTVAILANGMAGNPVICQEGEDFDIFVKALGVVTLELCKKIAGDGEGATKRLFCKVRGAKDKTTARKAAKSVICSSLVKSAMFGADANWGRVICAMGYSGADLDIDKVDISFTSKAGEIEVCKSGMGIAFSEEKAKEVLMEDEIGIIAIVGEGEGESIAWGCDLTYDYVKINGDYRT